MPPDYIENKFCRLDILMIVDGRQVNLEVQVEDEKNLPERVLYYWARTYSNALPAGRDYIELPQTILINILAFSLFKDYDGYHSQFQALEVTRHVSLSDKMIMHFFELEKLPDEIKKDNPLLLWLKLFKADTMEEIEMIEDVGETEVSEAVTAYRRVLSSAELQEMEFYRSCNETTAINRAVERATETLQGVIAEKDAEIAELKKKLEEQQS